MVSVNGVEFCVGIPGFVEVQVFHALLEPFLDLDRVVADPVVSGIGEGGHPDGLLFRVCRNERAAFDFRPDGFWHEFGKPNRSDDAASVAARDHVDRQGAGDGHSVVERFVAVAVDQCDVAVGHPAAPDDLIHGRGAVQNIIRLIGSENPGGVVFGIARRAFMVQQGAEFRN